MSATRRSQPPEQASPKQMIVMLRSGAGREAGSDGRRRPRAAGADRFGPDDFPGALDDCGEGHALCGEASAEEGEVVWHPEGPEGVQGGVLPAGLRLDGPRRAGGLHHGRLCGRGRGRQGLHSLRQAVRRAVRGDVRDSVRRGGVPRPAPRGPRPVPAGRGLSERLPRGHGPLHPAGRPARCALPHLHQWGHARPHDPRGDVRRLRQGQQPAVARVGGRRAEGQARL